MIKRQKYINTWSRKKKIVSVFLPISYSVISIFKFIIRSRPQILSCMTKRILANRWVNTSISYDQSLLRTWNEEEEVEENKWNCWHNQCTLQNPLTESLYLPITFGWQYKRKVWYIIDQSELMCHYVLKIH